MHIIGVFGYTDSSTLSLYNGNISYKTTFDGKVNITDSGIISGMYYCISTTVHDLTVHHSDNFVNTTDIPSNGFFGYILGTSSLYNQAALSNVSYDYSFTNTETP